MEDVLAIRIPTQMSPYLRMLLRSSALRHDFKGSGNVNVNHA